MTLYEQVLNSLHLWWLGYNKYPLMSGITASTVASLRMYQSSERVLWSESILCGIFAAIATICLSFIGDMLGMDIPVELSSGVGGVIGWYGTAKSIQFFESKVGGKFNDSDSRKL